MVQCSAVCSAAHLVRPDAQEDGLDVGLAAAVAGAGGVAQRGVVGDVEGDEGVAAADGEGVEGDPAQAAHAVVVLAKCAKEIVHKTA